MTLQLTDNKGFCKIVKRNCVKHFVWKGILSCSGAQTPFEGKERDEINALARYKRAILVIRCQSTTLRKLTNNKYDLQL